MLDLENKSYSFEELQTVECDCLYSGNYERESVQVSIIIPTFRRETLLLETIKSCQPIYGNPNYEIIVVFNARSEADMLMSFIQSERITNICVYENAVNIGMFQNWNMCVKNAFGKWVSIMHDDDMYEPTFFSYLAEILSSVPDDTAYINFNGRIVETERYEDLSDSTRNRIRMVSGTLCDVKILGVSPFFAMTCGSLIKRDAWIALGGIDKETYPSGDVLMPIKMIKNGYRCLVCRETVNCYRTLFNASANKEVMDLFVHFYIELQQAVYPGIKGIKKHFYRFFQESLRYKAINHVYLQAESKGITLDGVRPDRAIEKTIRYKLMDITQRAYWRLKRTTVRIEIGGHNK